MLVIKQPEHGRTSTTGEQKMILLLDEICKSFANGRCIKEVYTDKVFVKKMHMYNKNLIISDATLTITTNLKMVISRKTVFSLIKSITRLI